MDGRGEVIDTFGDDTADWAEAQLKYEKLTEDLDRRIILSIGCEWIREKLNSWDEDIAKC